MNQSTKEIGQPEQEPNNEQKADEKQVSPSIANALVGGSCWSFKSYTSALGDTGD